MQRISKSKYNYFSRISILHKIVYKKLSYYFHPSRSLKTLFFSGIDVFLFVVGFKVRFVGLEVN